MSCEKCPVCAYVCFSFVFHFSSELKNDGDNGSAANELENICTDWAESGEFYVDTAACVAWSVLWAVWADEKVYEK